MQKKKLNCKSALRLASLPNPAESIRFYAHKRTVIRICLRWCYFYRRRDKETIQFISFAAYMPASNDLSTKYAYLLYSIESISVCCSQAHKNSKHFISELFCCQQMIRSPCVCVDQMETEFHFEIMRWAIYRWNFVRQKSDLEKRLIYLI